MRGNSFGNIFVITTFGESHGEALGVVIDGMPSNIKVSVDDLREVLKKRRPGLPGTTRRCEKDEPIILSGVFNGLTLGTPIAVIVKNENQDSGAYDHLKDQFRVGHADRTTMLKYGIRDHRGGGRSSGRETVARVIAGYFASLIIPEVEVVTTVSRYGELNHPTKIEIEKYAEKLMEQNESVASEIVVRIHNVAAGLGEPVFDKLKACLAHAMLSIGGCVSFQMGENNNLQTLTGTKLKNDLKNFAGIEGGISNGEDIVFRVVFKSIASVGSVAATGRHDPCVVPRAIPVVEAMAKIVLADMTLLNRVGRNE